jgi:hypothetical protein
MKASVSLLLGAAFYAAWLAAFLWSNQLENAKLDRALFVLAPVVTSAGFATGVALVDKMAGGTPTGFFLSWVWALMGCSIGALAVYFYGTMLIVFTMLIGGTLAVVAREITGARSRRRHSF